jgi:hypothetical protein
MCGRRTVCLQSHRLTAQRAGIAMPSLANALPQDAVGPHLGFFNSLLAPNRTQVRNCAFATIIVGRRDCWSTRKAPVKACYVSTALVARAVYSLPSSPKNTASCWLRSPQHAGGTNPSGACGLRRGERADHVLGFRGGPHASLQRPQAQTASLQFVGGVGATDCRPGLRSPKMRLR